MIELDVALPLSRFTLRVAATLSADTVAVLGPSGSGKTSLLETIAGLRPKASGRIAIEGDVMMDSAAGLFVAPERRRIGYVPQDACLFPHLDVRGNVRFGMAKAGRAGLFDEAVAILEIAPLLDRFPSTLSGGERQRVALARAIATEPRLLLLDEPLAAVDMELKERILPYLLRVRDAMRIPFLYVTHNAGEAGMIAAEALLLREGTVALQGPVDTVLGSMTLPRIDPQTRFENILAGTLQAAEPAAETASLLAGTARLVVPAGQPAGTRARAMFAVSPEDILVSTEPPEHVSARNVLAGRVVGQQTSDAGTLLRVAAGGLEWTVKLTHSASEELALSPGVAAWLTIKAHAFRRLG